MKLPTMQTNTWTARAAIGIVALAILVAGGRLVRRMIASSDDTPRVIYELPKTRNSEQRKEILRRITRVQARPAPKPAETSSSAPSETDSIQTRSVTDPDESEERVEASDFEDWEEDEQDEERRDYDKRYDDLIGATTKVQSVLEQIKRIDEEIDRMEREWKRNVRDPKNPTEEEERAIVELKEEMGPMMEAREELNKNLGSFVEDVASAAPGALRTESHGAYKQRLTFDYSEIRSALGAPPERYDARLSEFFASFEYWSVSK